MEELAKAGNGPAQVLARLLDNPLHTSSPLSFIDSVAFALLVVTAAWASAQYFAPSYLAAAIILFIIGRIIGDLIAIRNALRVGLFAARPLAGLLATSDPFLRFAAWVVRKAKAPRLQTTGSDRLTSDDIQIIVAEGDQERKLEEINPEEREMIAGIIEMGERTARDIMIPRLDVIAIESDAPLDTALDVVTKYGHSRLPVYVGDIDHVIGILHVKDLIQVMRSPTREISLRQVTRPVHYVPDTAKADNLLRDLLRNRIHMAIVVDEYGGTVGIVTIEDALEEIVGEIRDEYDAAEEPEFVRLNEDEALFNGRIPISEVNDVMAIQLPEGDSDTLGGLVYTHLGRTPRVNDTVALDSVELKVTAMAGRRVKKVLVRRIHNEPAQMLPSEAHPTQK